MPARAPAGRSDASATASGSVPSESTTLGTCRRPSSPSYPRPALGHDRAQVPPGERRLHLVEVEEEYVVGARRAAPTRPARRRRRRARPRARAITVTSRNFGVSRSPTSCPDRPRPKPTPRAPRNRPRRPARPPGDGARPPGGARRRTGRPAPAPGPEPQVVGQHTEDVRRVLRPARHAQVDLGDGAVAVPAQECGEARCSAARQRAAPVARGQLGGSPAPRQRPQTTPVSARTTAARSHSSQVHLGGHVVRQPRAAPFPRRRRIGAAQEPAGQPNGIVAASRPAGARHDRHRADEQPFDGRSSRCAAAAPAGGSGGRDRELPRTPARRPAPTPAG